MSILERVLKKAIEDSNTSIALYAKDIKILQLRVDEENKLIYEATKALQDMCAHTNTKRVEGTYTPGGYDYVSEQNFTIECDSCGKVLESKCIRGTYA